MLALIDFEPGDAAAGKAAQQRARQRRRPAAQLDDVGALQRHQAGQQFEFVGDEWEVGGGHAVGLDGVIGRTA